MGELYTYWRKLLGLAQNRKWNWVRCEVRVLRSSHTSICAIPATAGGDYTKNSSNSHQLVVSCEVVASQNEKGNVQCDEERDENQR